VSVRRLSMAALLLASCGATPRPAPDAIPTASPPPSEAMPADGTTLATLGPSGADRGVDTAPHLPPPVTLASIDAASASVTTAPTAKPSARTYRRSIRLSGHRLRGTATWHATGRDGPYAAAGPELRAALGPSWRGKRVRVQAGLRSVIVTLNDWCWCPSRHRLLDLSDEAFRRLAPLSAGVLKVEVAW